MHEDKIREYLQYEQRLSPAQIEDFMREYNYLTDEERSHLIYDMVGRDLYKEYPVDIKTFIHDPYFLGTLYSETIFPIWEQTLQEIYPAPFCKRYNEALLSCATRCFGKGTKVRMFDGSVKNIEDIKVGEQVMGPDSKPRTVLQLAHGEEELFKITPNKGGNPFICNKHHRLALKKIRDRWKPDEYLEMTVEEFLSTVSKDAWNKHYRMYHSDAIEYPKKDLLIDPYIFGTWLGDGHTDAFRLTTIDQVIKEAWESYGSSLENCSVRVTELPNRTTPTWDISIGLLSKSLYRSGNKYLKYLKNIKETYGHKRIPSEYMTSSIEDRRAVLAGIIDTDGYYDNNAGKTRNGYISITTKYKDLAEDYANLARSLGYRATVKERNKFVKAIGKNYTSYDVNITGNFQDLPIKLARKQSCRESQRDLRLFKFQIESIGEGEFYGFTVDKDHKFLLEDYTVVLNSGKSTVIIISALYELYLILCAVSPSVTFGLKNTANMTFCFLSKDNSTACSQLGEDMHKGLSMAPYFKDTITKNLSFSTLDKKGVQITDNVVLKAGSTVNVITGTDLIFGCLDEANMPSPKIANENLVDSRTKLYTAMVDRRNSTYSNAAGLTGMIWLTSSPMDEGDVIGERINFVQENGVENVFIMDNVPRWVARNESMDDTFEFYLGSEVQDPCIIEESDVDREILDENRIIEVPRRTDYISQFRGQPRLAIQEIAGRRTLAENAFFPSVSMFQKVFSKENTIFKKDDLRINLDSGMEVSDYLYDPDYFSHPNKPECYRYIHLDMAEKKDRFGLASVYSDMEKYTSEEGEEIRVRKYYIDFCIGVSSSGGKAVDLLKILEFVYGLKKKGYPVKIVTTDSHQGELARQVLRKHGVKTEYQSVEKTKDAYFFLKNLILTGTLSGFKNQLLVKELSGLRETNKRVEKSKTTTDDLSDALAGACFLASQDAGFKSSNEAIYDLLNSGKNMASFNDYQMNSLMVNGSQFDSMDYLAQHLYIPKSNDDYFRNF